MNFFEMMAFDEADDADNAAPKPLPEAAVARLREAYAVFSQGNQYKPGQLVTPRADASIKGAGDPHIVLEVLDDPRREWAASSPHDIGTHNYGRLLNVRVACIMSGDIAAFWGEAWMYEPYAAPGAVN